MEEYNKLIFARNLDRYMQDRKTTRADICQLLGVSKSTVSEWLKGKKMPRMDKIEVLSNYFNINKSDLIEEKPPTSQGEELSPTKQKLLEMVNQMDDSEAAMLEKIVDAVLAERDK